MNLAFRIDLILGKQFDCLILNEYRKGIYG